MCRGAVICGVCAGACVIGVIMIFRLHDVCTHVYRRCLHDENDFLMQYV